jgi:hypothetical protein
MSVASLGTYVSIGLDSEHPYDYNPEHVRKYPKEKYKGKGGNDAHGKGGKK